MTNVITIAHLFGGTSYWVSSACELTCQHGEGLKERTLIHVMLKFFYGYAFSARFGLVLVKKLIKSWKP